MEDHQFSRCTTLDVEFDSIHPEIQALAKGGQGIFWSPGTPTTMGKEKNFSIHAFDRPLVRNIPLIANHKCSSQGDFNITGRRLTCRGRVVA
ncbi:MAG: hypothetical protein R3D26_08695 [Cyanobacteriota/Melainabacteria group bacterium]